MKRSPELTPLSHSHHKGLFAAMQLRDAEDLDAAVAALLEYWEVHGAEHFRIEEEVLLPAWLELDDGADPELAKRVIAEHLDLRVIVRRARRGDASLEQLRSCGDDISTHIRFEERELFPMIEAALGEDDLRALGAELKEAEGEDEEE